MAVIILTGNDSGVSFCAGLKVSEAFGDPSVKNWFYGRHYSNHTLGDIIPSIRKPIICAVSGHCYGAGFEMAMACDMMLVTEDVKLCLPEVNLGMNTANGGTTRLTQSARKSNSMLKCLTGGVITG